MLEAILRFSLSFQREDITKMNNAPLPANRPLQQAAGFALLALAVLTCFLFLPSCNRAEQGSYREVSSVGFGAAPPDNKLLYQRGIGGIPSLTWFDGTVTAIADNPKSFDPVVGQTAGLTVTLSQAAILLRVSVLDSLNGTVKVLYNQQASSGVHNFSWNGKDNLGQNARYSIYVFSVVAFNNRMQEIGHGQTEVITYRPKAGVTIQDANKYVNANGEFDYSSDEWVAAGLANPGDNVQVLFDGMPRGLANNEPNGMFRSLPISYTPGAHTVKVTVFPRMTQTSYDIDYSVYLNRIYCTGLSVLLNGNPVGHNNTYFIPGSDENVKLDYALDAAEDGAFMYVSYMPPNGSDPILRRTIDLGAQTAGPHTVSWDGKDDLGVTCAPGKYSISVMTDVDPAAAQFRPSVIFITKFINLQEVGQ
jgi:flagellar hook assembly protein FlgD